MCQGFSGVNATINTVGNQINQGICNLGYTVQGSFNDLSHQISDCCCTTQRAIDGINYNMATLGCDIKSAIFNSTRDIIDSQKDGTQAILGFLTNEKIEALRAENLALKGQVNTINQNAFITANQEAQTAELIRRLGRDCPTPAFIVPNPNCCYNYNVTGVGYGNNGNCGCGNCF